MKEVRETNNFDFLRFYFAFVVVIAHLIKISNADVLKPFAFYFNTYFSITGFFIISGFLITKSFLRNTSLFVYFKKRAARLLPAYLLVIFLCALFLSFTSTYSFSEYFSSPQLYKYLAANLGFLNFIQPCLPGVFEKEGMMCAVNGALWTLKIEVGFYILVPVLIYLLGKLRKKYILLIIIYVLSFVYRIVLNDIAGYTGNNLYVFLARQLPGFLSFFVCGMALHYYFDFLIKHKYLLGILGIGLFFIDKIIPFSVFTPIGLTLIIFAFAYSFKFLNSFGKFGDFSYGIYIYHFPIIQAATYFGFFERYNPFLVAACIILIVLCLSVLSWHLLEKRFLKLASN